MERGKTERKWAGIQKRSQAGDQNNCIFQLADPTRDTSLHLPLSCSSLLVSVLLGHVQPDLQPKSALLVARITVSLSQLPILLCSCATRGPTSVRLFISWTLYRRGLQ